MANPSAVDQLVADLTEAIMTGDLAAGTWLRQQGLAERFGVSRQPVREALRQVEAQRLVEIHPHRGALVRLPTPRDIREAYLVRADLEGLAAELAAERIAPDGLALLADAVERFEGLATEQIELTNVFHAEWSRINDAFHEAVLTAAEVDILYRTVQHLHLLVPRNLTRSALRTPRLVRRNVAEHGRIHEAIAAGRPQAARKAMTSHVRSSGELMADRFERQQQLDGGSSRP